MEDAGYVQCKRCLMDSSASNISFDSSGICNFCTEFELNGTEIIAPSEKQFLDFIGKVKTAGKNKKYDCVIGVSGGVDSSWVLVNAIRSGLKPLAVHMDNGWNSELAQNNIHNLVTKLGVDLYTHVIDWSEYRELMQSFFDADVVDIELLYDNAMTAVNYKMASKYGIKYILSGQNIATEGMAMPEGWNWFKYDALNIKDIIKRNNSPKIKTFPLFSIWGYAYYRLLRGITWTSPLDLLPYNKEIALSVLESEFGYKRYPYKHYESIFTRFYQGYLLPRKFGIDKRKLHLSSLIMTNQLSRTDGLELLSRIPYPTEQELMKDTSYFLKKMKWDESDLNDYLKRPRREHDEYKNSFKLWRKIKRIYLLFK